MIPWTALSESQGWSTRLPTKGTCTNTHLGITLFIVSEVTWSTVGKRMNSEPKKLLPLSPPCSCSVFAMRNAAFFFHSFTLVCSKFNCWCSSKNVACMLVYVLLPFAWSSTELEQLSVNYRAQYDWACTYHEHFCCFLLFLRPNSTEVTVYTSSLESLELTHTVHIRQTLLLRSVCFGTHFEIYALNLSCAIF